jgi:hypothetical protein
MPVERRDVDVGMTARVVAGLLAAVVVVAGLMALLLGALGGPVPRPHGLPDQAADFPAPPLRVQPLDEPADYARDKEPLLDQWGWADGRHQLARIPVDQAARIVAERGWR